MSEGYIFLLADMVYVSAYARSDRNEVGAMLYIHIADKQKWIKELL